MSPATPEPARLPTEEELYLLPPRAVVALAARCARRVFPLFGPAERIPDCERHRAALSQAIAAAEACAAGSGIAGAAARATYLVSYATRATAHPADAAAHAAARAAYAAAYAADTADQGADPVPFAVDACTYAAAYTPDVAAIRGDYELLSEKLRGDDPCVPPEFFAPLPPPDVAAGPAEGEEGSDRP
jgi:hypothetical protein